MRLKIFGISKIGLAFFGLLPSLAWLAFYHRFEWPMVILLLMAFVFPFLFCRGIFQVRFGVFLSIAAEVLFEMIQGVLDRDFIRIFKAVLVFAVAFGLSRWIEAKVKCASLNPEIHWFEGKAQTLPQGSVRLVIQGENLAGGLRKIDSRGFFVFLQTKLAVKAGDQIPFELTFKESSVSGEGRVSAAFLGDQVGIGLQFSPKDLYHFSQYTSVVSRMRGEGL